MIQIYSFMEYLDTRETEKGLFTCRNSIKKHYGASALISLWNKNHGVCPWRFLLAYDIATDNIESTQRAADSQDLLTVCCLCL